MSGDTRTLDGQRVVLPRWRRSRAPRLSQELIEPPDPLSEQTEESISDEMDRRWGDRSRIEGSTTTAELLSAGLVLDRLDGLEDIAERAIADSSAMGIGAGRVAEVILHRLGGEQDSDLADTFIRYPRAELHQLRDSLRNDPRNALDWLDMALLYATMGQTERAKSAMTMGLRLGGNSRFVLRVATRFFVHVDEPDRAHDLLVGSGRADSDPWIAAPVLSTAVLAGRSLRSVRHLRRLLDESDPGQSTELASALATHDLAAGSDRRATKGFKASLVAPTENTLAQAEWVTHRTSLNIDVEPTLMDLLPFSFEARSRRATAEGSVYEAIEAAELWHQFQPFSVEPAAHGSYVASVGAGDFERAVKIAKMGLVANPNDPWLLNNHAFAAANLGDVATAASDMSRLTATEIAESPTATATTGLIAYRSGDYAGGYRLYEKAAAALSRSGARSRVSALVALFWAREEIQVSGDRSTKLAERALRLADRVQEPEVEFWAGRVRQAFEEYSRGT